MVPPVPFPNTVVKRASADDTWWATAWENRSSPGLSYPRRPSTLHGRGPSLLYCVDLAPVCGIAREKTRVGGDTGNKVDNVKSVERDDYGKVKQLPGDVRYVRDAVAPADEKAREQGEI
jgi:hypothetical protein